MNILLLSILPLVSASAPPPQHLLSNPPFFSPDNRIPTVHQSAILARRILNLSSIATLSTVFPSTTSIDHDVSTLSRPASDLGGDPIGLMDYYASCSPQTYNPTILAISIATTFRNTRAGSNVTLSLRWHPPATAPPSDDIYTYSPANMPRFSLVGYIEPIPPSEVLSYDVEACFLDKHPDAEAWLPGNKIHQSWWGRLVVREVYWIGGFGDRAYIGWIPEEEWSAVTENEVAKARLVGEDGYRKDTGSLEQEVLEL
ncbi:hypothetical protein IMSHALPRED_010008 [Imshaugia aleurites]|uniref:CREG-like beta-barrel domain-containing protein n=1 Tax=Imshaugia aleurites TaxID=172621 RepID=A0A8H3EQ63_9LECA|nr:hypothetical protein IMSHALPRED_010008 [Imshaugia aleurites]